MAYSSTSGPDFSALTEAIDRLSCNLELNEATTKRLADQLEDFSLRTDDLVYTYFENTEALIAVIRAGVDAAEAIRKEIQELDKD